MEIIFEALFAWPFMGLFQGIAGVAWPSENVTIRRLQRLTGVILIAGLISAAVALMAAWLDATPILMPAVVAWLCFIVAGLLGNHIEQTCKQEDSDAHECDAAQKP